MMYKVAKAECSKCHVIAPKTHLHELRTRGEGSLGFRANNKGTRGLSYYRGRMRTVWLCDPCMAKRRKSVAKMCVVGMVFFAWWIMFASISTDTKAVAQEQIVERSPVSETTNDATSGYRPQVPRFVDGIDTTAIEQRISNRTHQAPIASLEDLFIALGGKRP